ncbi:secretory phospholipase A2 receptor isoform X2 [Ictalurus punctatus]|uniref:Secretory phospholipase A2 receptor isoform X2 n=1 Tax=Ictalurus punctatus TaxID=7998 RepID=A0A9F7RNQ1_ICTPU|nr:secretory phospholipase A2 receptor isoform X2 [Ictalurus punctatus]
MATVSVLLLLLSAFSPPVHSRRSIFQIIPSEMNQTAARAACRENYIDLVTVYSDEDNTELHNMMMNYGYWSWIGLYRSNFSEKWSNADPVTFRNLAGDCGTSSYCAAMKADGSWESLQCTGTRYFMCYEEDASSQTPNYHLILESETWSGAQRYCRGNYTDLVSIRDQQQNEEVKIKGLNSTTSFWIGLLCDDWQWTDGGNSAYRNWGSGQPQSSPYDCVILSEWGWISVPCNNNYPPLCYSTFSPPVHSRLSTFYVIMDSMTQTAARAACRENYIDLVTVYSDEDYTDLYNMKPYWYWRWIGLYRSNFSEKWSNGDPVTFRNLAGDCGNSSRCAAMKTDGSWESLQCTGTRYFMCYEDASSQTPNYHLILESKTWSGAQRYCRRNYTDLVSIRDQQQNEEVKIKGLNSTTSFWIGLLCDDWQWTDGGNSTYRNWAKWSGHPLSSPYDCVVLSEWGWYSVACSDNYPPLCYSTSIHVSDEALSWEEALDYCREGNRAGILNIDSESEQEELESELRRRRVPPGNLWVGLGPNRLSEMKVSSGPLTCEDVERQTEPPLSHCAADTHAAEAAPDYVMNSAELRVVCKLK